MPQGESGIWEDRNATAMYCMSNPMEQMEATECIINTTIPTELSVVRQTDKRSGTITKYYIKYHYLVAVEFEYGSNGFTAVLQPTILH
eukprot:scaffold673470_cov83-Prasinocladus_malaysianus.AAC.1